MRISLIVAMGNNRQIGKNNQLLWHISDDLKNFKKLTLGHHMLMGRKTYESIGRPLPGRTTIILSRKKNYSAEGCFVVTSYEEALKIPEAAGDSEFFICGGEEIYKNFLGKADRYYLSLVDFDGEADAVFPEFSSESLNIIEEVKHEKTEKNPAWVYQVLER
ncbi:MAG: dihydrofolate reductase [Spirochaetaceae bacterium]|jgi:dihydrofolate reductase|nr:dihydrofolate reductase [Spirochaetaceae bacterium]